MPRTPTRPRRPRGASFTPIDRRDHLLDLPDAPDPGPFRVRPEAVRQARADLGWDQPAPAPTPVLAHTTIRPRPAQIVRLILILSLVGLICALGISACAGALTDGTPPPVEPAAQAAALPTAEVAPTPPPASGAPAMWAPKGEVFTIDPTTIVGWLATCPAEPALVQTLLADGAQVWMDSVSAQVPANVYDALPAAGGDCEVQ